MLLAEPAESLTDLLLGAVTVSLAWRLRTSPAGRHWRTAFWCFGAAALAGAVRHGVVAQLASRRRRQLGAHQRRGRRGGVLPAGRHR